MLNPIMDSEDNFLKDQINDIILTTYQAFELEPNDVVRVVFSNLSNQVKVSLIIINTMTREISRLCSFMGSTIESACDLLHREVYKDIDEEAVYFDSKE